MNRPVKTAPSSLRPVALLDSADGLKDGTPKKLLCSSSYVKQLTLKTVIIRSWGLFLWILFFGLFWCFWYHNE
ncbi:hypothetical protein [Paenibacillus sp. y28]|uniref:hypothetical protein n=1 Tax=Paenibacillus sp. y28 TaxID=3129110 RepID=UPI0030184D12